MENELWKRQRLLAVAYSFSWSERAIVFKKKIINYSGHEVILAIGLPISKETYNYLFEQFGSIDATAYALSKYTKQDWQLFHLSEVMAGRARSLGKDFLDNGDWKHGG